MILDTNALSALLAGDVGILRLLADIERQTIPAIVLGEYRFGVAASKIRRQLASVLDELEDCSTILGVDEVTARHYSDVKAALRAIGRPIPENDLWIAALARQHHLPVVTHDEHFANVPGVKMLRWRAP